MAGSTSENFKNEFEAFVAHFGSLMMGEDGVLKSQSGTNDHSGSFSYCAPATQNPERDAIDNEQNDKRRDQLLAPQETHETTQGFSRNSVSNQGDVWVYHNSDNLRKNSVYGLFSPNENFCSNNHIQTSSSGLWNQNGQCSGTNFECVYPRSNFNSNAGIRIGLQGENIEGIPFADLLDSIFLLMKHETGHVLFDELIDSCIGDELHLVVLKLWSNIDLFIEAAFCRIGSNSIQKLIKKLKRTPYTYTMTRILSSRFYQIMTHDFARHVILQCLNLLDRKSNEIFYECAIHDFLALARHEVGCRSLNECINSIAGNQRDTLLNRIAAMSDFLSNDPYGNYVVQHVLELRNDLITKKILGCLQGQFIQLSKTKGGSHVVEKCIESSAFGCSFVVTKLLDSSNNIVRLSQHQFGNFVIQKALLRTKIEGQMHLHETLVMILEKHAQKLKLTKSGNHVINRLDLEFYPFLIWVFVFWDSGFWV
ncbi:unnamed protein product [Fraxinus pennsylvanica]|uniref:PUM-HD domain-containing protein n=1 Tax=Fraxinus pennsylvanica TaxID=56036 RepID=A0AAD2AA23_9LAMI|nr:unnamed protein product [Fraxinus pennsylvanica]